VTHNNGEQHPHLTSKESRHARADRRERGKSLRKSCPRSSHADVVLGQPKRDPMALLEDSNRDRLKNLLPIRFTRMAESAFAFFRGTAVLQAHDLQGTPSAGITVQCCGDCHLMNFGGFATPERTLIFDINDFDETHPGPFEWDVKRLAVSFVLSARWRGFDKSDAKRMATTAVASYRTAMAQYAEMSVLETWYAQISLEHLLDRVADNAALEKIVRKGIRKAQENTSDHVFEKITTTVDGQTRIAVQPPLLYHTPNYEQHMREEMEPFFKRYRETLPAERQALFDRYRLVDTAGKVVGVGSVGTRCFIALLMGNQDDPLFLQIKEARPSVFAGRADTPLTKQNGERVVTGQRLMQSASDIFLGWTTGSGGRDFYVRQLRDMKVAPDITDHTPRHLTAYAEVCGHALARAHAKAGDATTIAGYLGSSETFEKSIAAYAIAYANHVEEDYEKFRSGIRSGRFPTETTPSDVEEAIR